MIEKLTHINPSEAFELIKKGAVIVDVRPDFQSLSKVFDVEKQLVQ